MYVLGLLYWEEEFLLASEGEVVCPMNEGHVVKHFLNVVYIFIDGFAIVPAQLR